MKVLLSSDLIEFKFYIITLCIDGHDQALNDCHDFCLYVREVTDVYVWPLQKPFHVDLGMLVK